ncbi:hypothetical protein BDN72DRAFT_845402 [Pluteus cervinus]|uniref:Uncharacterized protein n=1 Tax=Pluteus cervinus TaxID=181527 RepID=A0ACD3AI08_9AGAR|nr:hypothetical protein BDN72DRAFT_845402 [Pluteus cervinus]
MSGTDSQQPVVDKKRKSKETVANPPNKRMKHPHPSLPDFIKHPTFWADDGSVLVQIEDVRMRLHRSRLKTNSTWFAELFDGKISGGIYDPDIMEQDDDGLPLYRLDMMDVKLNDFEVLLTAMDNALDFFLEKPTFSCIAALIRVSSTLQFPRFFSYAESILDSQFSRMLSPPFSVKEAVEAIDLGRRYSHPQLVKRAFYELARVPGQFRLLVTPNEDQLPKGSSPLLERLDVGDFAILLDLQRELSRTWLELTDLPPIGCTQPGGVCASSSPSKTWEIVHGTGIMKEHQLDPMSGICKLAEIDWKGNGYCDGCRNERIRFLTEQRTKLWVEKMETWLNLQVPL